MANNRMYLVNTKTRQCLCIAKCYARAWYVIQDTTRALDEMLADELREPFSRGLPSLNWRIEYEHANGKDVVEHNWQKCLTCSGRYAPGEKRPTLDEYWDFVPEDGEDKGSAG